MPLGKPTGIAIAHWLFSRPKVVVLPKSPVLSPSGEGQPVWGEQSGMPQLPGGKETELAGNDRLPFVAAVPQLANWLMSAVAPAALLDREVVIVGLNGDASAMWPPRPINTNDTASASSSGSNKPREVQTLLIEKPPSKNAGRTIGRWAENRLRCTPYLTAGQPPRLPTDAVAVTITPSLFIVKGSDEQFPTENLQ